MWIEGRHLLRKDGWTYLLCAEGGTGNRHLEVVFRARELDEPARPWAGNPTLAQRAKRYRGSRRARTACPPYV